jgi:hypothetical protein
VIDLNDLKPGMLIEAEIRIVGKPNRTMRIRIDRTPWPSGERSTILSDGRNIESVLTDTIRVIPEPGDGGHHEEQPNGPLDSFMTTDPEVATCTARHSKAPVAKCAGCGICEECDVTLDLTDDGRVLCEVCQAADEERREERNQLWPYTAAGAPHSR